MQVHTDPSSVFVFGEAVSLVKRGEATGVDGTVCRLYFVQSDSTCRLADSGYPAASSHLISGNTDGRRRRSNVQTSLLYLC